MVMARRSLEFFYDSIRGKLCRLAFIADFCSSDLARSFMDAGIVAKCVNNSRLTRLAVANIEKLSV